MQYSLRELFPQLTIKLAPAVYSVTYSDLENNCYFNHLIEDILSQYNHADSKNSKNHHNKVPFPLKDLQQFVDLKSTISKIMPKVIPVKVPKGTIIYSLGAAPDEGYFLVHGCVDLLAKKNNWEKLESLEGPTLFNTQDRAQYLFKNYRINPKHFEMVEPIFYEDKMIFNLIPFRKVYSGDYFGFKELLRGCMRTKVAIAVEDSLLLKLKRQDFDKYLKEYEQKRQQYIINCISSGVKQEIIEDVLPRLPIVFNSSEVISFDKDEEIFKEDQFSSGIYFLLAGEVTVSKQIKLEIPKKYLLNENQKQIIKQVNVKLHKVVKNSFVGQIQPLLSLKNRQFTFTAAINSTIMLKLDSTAFLKTISQSSLYERELSMSAKHKYSVTSDSYLKLKNQIVKSYLNQFQQFDHKKKQKNIVGLLNNDVNFKQNQLYEVFKKEGLFYRDSFQRLEGFQKFQATFDPKRASIHRHKIKSTLQQPPANTNSFRREIKATQWQNPTEQQGDLSFEATKKILMSPGKASSNPFEVLGAELIHKISPISEHSSTSGLRKKHRITPKFQQLKRDETVYKRVLIKNGKFEVSRETNKSNLVKAIVNHQFDEVVSQCMTRKNVALRKAFADNRKDLIKQEFKKTLSTLPQRCASMTRLSSISFGYTCKGTQQMKKRLQKLKWTKGPQTGSGERVTEDPRLEECIGFNRKPLSSQIKYRSIVSACKVRMGRTPQKIVLVNHMMKPITYTSTQL